MVIDKFDNGPSKTETPRWRRNLRHIRQNKPQIETTLVALQSGAAGVMLGLAVYSSTDLSGFDGALKATLLASTAAITNFSLVHFSLKFCAPLAAAGLRFVAPICSAAIVICGSGLAMSTFSGLIAPSVERARLEQHQSDLAAFIGQQNKAVQITARLAPALGSAVDELSPLLRCEISVGCVSGQKSGRGVVAQTLETFIARASGLIQKFQFGQANASRKLTELNEELDNYRKAMDASDSNVRSETLKVHARITQKANELRETLPLSTVREFAKDAGRPISVPNNPEGSQRLNAVMTKHSEAILAIIGEQSKAEADPPNLPTKVGVATTLSYIPQYLSLALLLLGSEIIFGLLLLWIRIWRLSWQIEQAERYTGPEPITIEGFDRPVLPPPAEKPEESRRRNRDRASGHDRDRDESRPS